MSVLRISEETMETIEELEIMMFPKIDFMKVDLSISDISKAEIDKFEHVIEYLASIGFFESKHLKFIEERSELTLKRIMYKKGSVNIKVQHESSK